MEPASELPQVDNPANTQPTPTTSKIIATTYHSVIEPTIYNSLPAVLKKFTFPENPRTLHRWRKEVEALNLARGHPNISQILHSSPSPPTITLRHEPGLSLEKYINPQTSHCTLLPSEARAIWSQIASALSHLHQNCNIIHDDVKADNIIFFFSPSPHASSHQGTHQPPHAVLIDFGAALTSPSTLPQNGWTPSGTPPYAPPEFLHRHKSYVSDIWGLGVTLLFCFGYVPLPTGSWILPHVFEDEAVKREMEVWLDEIEELRTSLSSSGDEGKVFLGRMLERDPGTRIGSVELAGLLNPI
ncbi:kinase-like domain-containing protein [Colletotrichum phormii]|uniref:Kinase-like domain-containing protein n=1 Tax=Colletotrichum phormii TaxID=359342 RepID=A0AAI9ZQB3_9PEZI|nr:kinase-like domain-containing protein [Colletotrichum phormii]KAK1636230.1 kinase-like domain-containing protein [Colletotrichum phormii]